VTPGPHLLSSSDALSSRDAAAGRQTAAIMSGPVIVTTSPNAVRVIEHTLIPFNNGHRAAVLANKELAIYVSAQLPKQRYLGCVAVYRLATRAGAPHS
jgi:hypothetical protein